MKMKRIYLVLLALGMLLTACVIPDNVEALMTNALRNGLALIDDMNQNEYISRFLCQYS
jgi:hypothetical protein